MGHRAASELFDGPVVVEEKIDGSQFSFGVIDGVAEGATRREAGWSLDWSRVGMRTRHARGGVLTAHDVALRSARYAFGNFWDRINAKRHGGAYSWERNPWVWVIEYARTERQAVAA